MPTALLKTPESEPGTPLAAATALFENALSQGGAGSLNQTELHDLVVALVRYCGARGEENRDWVPLQTEEGREMPTATEVMATVSQILRAVDLQVFELGMWQSWTGR